MSEHGQAIYALKKVYGISDSTEQPPARGRCAEYEGERDCTCKADLRAAVLYGQPLINEDKPY